MAAPISVSTLYGHTSFVHSIAFNFDGSKIVSGSFDNEVKIWDVRESRCVSTLEGHEAWVTSVAFGPKPGNKVVSGSADKTLKLWNVVKEECMFTFPMLDIVYAVAFNHDGSLVIGASNAQKLDNCIKVWGIDSGECIATLNGHSYSVYSVSFNRDSSKIVSGSHDHTIKLWDCRKGFQDDVIRSTLTGHDAFVFAVNFNDNGTKIISSNMFQTSLIQDNMLPCWLKPGAKWQLPTTPSRRPWHR